MTLTKEELLHRAIAVIEELQSETPADEKSSIKLDGELADTIAQKGDTVAIPVVMLGTTIEREATWQTSSPTGESDLLEDIIYANTLEQDVAIQYNFMQHSKRDYSNFSIADLKVDLIEATPEYEVTTIAKVEKNPVSPIDSLIADLGLTDLDLASYTVTGKLTNICNISAILYVKLK